MTEEDALKTAEPIVRAIVDCIAKNKYELIYNFAEFSEGISPEVLSDVIDEFMSDAEITHIDKYGVQCMILNRSRPQLRAIIYSNGKGFYIEYDFSTNGELNDLTLQMKFLIDDKGGFRAYIEDCHVL
ncbi:MAG: hypothetical protein IJ736_14870 [Firmicutes bacterium]|nr:hypothetical protein [Bacillota bacterium]